MAVTLARARFTVIGYDISEQRRSAVEQAGIRFCATLADVVHGADALVLSLPLADDVEAVVTAPGGLLERCDRRVVVIDTSTSNPDTTRRLAARLHAAGHALLDAPVSGGPSGASNGTLIMMLGGEEADVATVRPVLNALSAKVEHVGPSGSGNVAKLVNNLLVASHLVIAGEAMRLSEAAGLPAPAALRIINAATGRSAISEVMFPRWILSGTFDSGFTAGLMRKDVQLALDLAAAAGSQLPLSAHVGQIWEAARDRVADGEDFTRIADYRPRRANGVIRSNGA